MAFFEGIERRLGLMDRMAGKLHAEIRNESPAVYRAAVLRCASCGAADACQGWLDRHDTAEAAPGYCRNKDLLEGLAQRG